MSIATPFTQCADILEETEAEDLLSRLAVPGSAAIAERAIGIHLEAFDWNCQRHITPRYTAEQIEQAIHPLQLRIRNLEEENYRLRSSMT